MCIICELQERQNKKVKGFYMFTGELPDIAIGGTINYLGKAKEGEHGYEQATDPFDLEMMNGNETTITGHNKGAGITRFMLKNPVPMEYFKAVTGEDVIPILEDIETFLV